MNRSAQPRAEYWHLPRQTPIRQSLSDSGGASAIRLLTLRVRQQFRKITTDIWGRLLMPIAETRHVDLQ